MELNTPSQVISKLLNGMDELHADFTVKEKESNSHKDKCTSLVKEVKDKNKTILKRDQSIETLQSKICKLENSNLQYQQELKSLKTTLNESLHKRDSEEKQYESVIRYLKSNLNKSEYANQKFKEENETEKMVHEYNLDEMDKELKKSKETIHRQNLLLNISDNMIVEQEANMQDIKDSLKQLCCYFTHDNIELVSTGDYIKHLDEKIKTITQKNINLKEKYVSPLCKNVAKCMEILFTLDKELDNDNPSSNSSNMIGTDVRKEPSASWNGQPHVANQPGSSVSLTTHRQKSKTDDPQFTVTNSHK